MAKPVIKFSAVPYEIGGKKGLRPQLEAQPGVYDLDFCTEVVNEKRLAMSPDELLHAIEMLGEVGPAKVAQDGRPRVITKLLKYNRYAKGKLESPTSPWNASCKAYIRAQLMSDVEKLIDGTFVNVSDGIGVRLNYVAWLGAQSVIDVVKIGKQIGVYGNHMEFIAGDTATLTVGTACHPLVCMESDVAHAVFAWPGSVAPEAGTQAVFEMKSRGGVDDGQVYTSKKTVTILAGDPPTPGHPTLLNLRTDSADGADELSVADGIMLLFDKADPDGATGHLVVNGVEQPAPVTVTETNPWVMWTFGRDELVGQTVTFKFRFEDGTETGNVTKLVLGA